MNQAANSGSTPLLTAASLGNEGVVKVLLGAGADKSLKNSDGKTALDFARSEGHSTTAKLLE